MRNILEITIDLARETSAWYEKALNAQLADDEKEANYNEGVATGLGIARDIIEANMFPSHFEEVTRV